MKLNPGPFNLLFGDCAELLKKLEPNSVDAVVTDPPYGLSFMGKKWDYDVPKIDLWVEVLRVLKPGGHLLSFGGTRTYHRMVCAIEDAGFEIRDQVQWIYGSGFPKSLDVSKAIDKQNGDTRPVVGPNINNRDRSKHEYNSVGNVGSHAQLTSAASAASAAWTGWGTALKPANEPIVLARKPLEKGLTVAQNVLKYGTGALNIDGTRIGTETIKISNGKGFGDAGIYGTGINTSTAGSSHQGRWPANVLFDESAALALDLQAGNLGKSTGGRTVKRSGKYVEGKVSAPGKWTNEDPGYGDSGGPSRFFYVAKCSKRERNAGLEGVPQKETHRLGSGIGRTDGANSDNTRPAFDKNHHPTVKPIKLMEYLIRLITPPGGCVLDPFAGSCSTGVAAIRLGFQFIGIEREVEYVEIGRRRLAHAQVSCGKADYNLRSEAGHL